MTRTHLKQWVPCYDCEEPLQTLPTSLDDLIREPIREHLAGERRDVDASRLALENVPERLKVGVASPHYRMAQLEGRDVRLQGMVAMSAAQCQRLTPPR